MSSHTEGGLCNVLGVAFSHGDSQRDLVVISGFTAIADWFTEGDKAR